MWLSGEKLGQWLYKHWPFDVYATIAVFTLIVCLTGVIYLKMRPDVQERIKKCTSWVAYQFASSIVGMITLPWKIVRGLIMEEDHEGKYQFAGFKMMFMLCSFVMLFRLGFSGGSIDELKIGEPIKSKVGKKNTKRKGKRNKSKVNKNSHGIYIKKLHFSHIAFYELLIFLTFCGMYYYRKDLNEGDQGNGLDKVLETAREAILYKYGGRPVQSETTITNTSTDVSAGVIEKEEIKVKTSGRKRKGKKIVSESEDPFLQ